MPCTSIPNCFSDDFCFRFFSLLSVVALNLFVLFSCSSGMFFFVFHSQFVLCEVIINQVQRWLKASAVDSPFCLTTLSSACHVKHRQRVMSKEVIQLLILMVPLTRLLLTWSIYFLNLLIVAYYLDRIAKSFACDPLNPKLFSLSKRIVCFCIKVFLSTKTAFVSVMPSFQSCLTLSTKLNKASIELFFGLNLN